MNSHKVNKSRSGRSPGGENGNPVFLPENSMDRGDYRATVHEWQIIEHD